MASETYYLFFSIILVIGGILQIANMVCYRVSGATLVGNRYKSGTLEYARLKKLSSSAALTVAGAVFLAVLANLAFDIYRVLHLANKQYAHSVLIYAPVSCVVATILMILSLRNKYKNTRPSN